jgi:GTP-binding protein
MNPFKDIKFLTSVADLGTLPSDLGSEVAFAGSSNSGKSSAINAIVARNGLAKTSKTPGRTQLINFFEIKENFYLVDLPGYGYAKVPEKIKRQWHKLLNDYFVTRKSLCGIILTTDIRHALRPFDWQMIEFAIHQGIPTHILLTKSDKLKRGAQQNILLKITKDLSSYEDLISLQLFSSVSLDGVDAAREKISKLLSVEYEVE